jgi:hypothetical protein
MSSEFSCECTLVCRRFPSAYAMQCMLKSNIYFNSQGCEQDQKEWVQDWGFDWIFDWYKIFGRVWDSSQNLIWSQLAQILPCKDHCGKRCLIKALPWWGVFLNYQTTFGITMQTSCPTRFLVQPTAIANQTRLFYTRVPFKYYTRTT